MLKIIGWLAAAGALFVTLMLLVGLYNSKRKKAEELQDSDELDT